MSNTSNKFNKKIIDLDYNFDLKNSIYSNEYNTDDGKISFKQKEDSLRKESNFKEHRPLKYQEKINYKNKFDNRLHYSFKFVTNDSNITEQNSLDTSNYINQYTLTNLFYVPKITLFHRYRDWKKNVFYGNNKSGYKKVNQVFKYTLRCKTYTYYNFGLGFISCLFIAKYYKNKLERRNNIWIEGYYGDYEYMYTGACLYYIYYYPRLIRCKLHEYKILYSPSFLNKNNIKYSSARFDYYCRLKDYLNKRDYSLDFINPGLAEKEYESQTKLILGNNELSIVV